MPPRGGGITISTCMLRVGLAWLIPAGAAIATSTPLDSTFYTVAAAASLVEVVVWACHKNKDMRRMLACGLARRASYVVRFALLLAIQCSYVVSWLGLSADFPGLPSLPSQADLLSASQPAGRDSRTRGGERGAAPAPPQQAPSASAPPRAPSTPAPAPAEPRVGAWGRDMRGRFVVDAPPETLRWSPRTISVVLPCAEERDYALKTVQAVFNSTPADVLKEIIVVDDGSEPPLSETYLKPDVQKRYRVRVLRHNRTVGLIGAKKTGGDAMVGDIGAFFDCHVAPQKGWYKGFLRLIGENYRRLVVPQITGLDIKTWTQQKGSDGVAKCYLTWDADFKWFESDDLYAAVTSGGLLGMSKRWWTETGGYDENMLGWGGENLDQALRVWLCGGEILSVPDSQVAHMWRSGDKRTNARYKHVGDTMVNRARAVYAWYGEFAEKLKDFPTFAARSDVKVKKGLPWYGDLSNIMAVKDRLRCRPFAWFLRRFKFIYEDGGLIPQEVFMLREERTGKCLRFQGHAGTALNGEATAVLTSCDPSGSGSDPARLFWHKANRRPGAAGRSGACCSGLRAWNTDQCLQDVAGKKFKTGVCDVSGKDDRQHWALRSNGELHLRNLCCGVDQKGALRKRPCSAFSGTGTRWTKHKPKEPIEMKLYMKARRAAPTMFDRLDREMARLDAASGRGQDPCAQDPGCVYLLKPGGRGECLDMGMEWTLEMEECLALRFQAEKAGAKGAFGKGWGELRSTLEGTLCLDRWNDEDPATWGLTECHGGVNQKLKIEKKEGRVCDMTDQCLEYRRVVPEKT